MTLRITPTELIHDLLSKHDGLVLGDLHDTPAVHDAIAKLVPALRSAGATRLYVEMLPIEAQPLLDLLHTPDGDAAELREVLHQRLGGYRPEPTDKYMAIINAAHDNGIEVIAMDAPPSDGQRVVGSRNEKWHTFIEKQNLTLGDGEKYAVMAGALHIDQYNRFAQDYEHDVAEGIDRKLGIPSITFDPHPNLSPRDRIVRASHPSDMAGDYKIVIPEKLAIQPAQTLAPAR